MTFPLRSLLFRVADALCVRRCICCGALIGKEGIPLCEDCAPAYLEAKEEECPTCSHSVSRCLCAEKHLERHGIRKHVKLFRYETETDAPPVQNRILLRLKRKDIRSTFDFLADELAEGVRAQIDLSAHYIIVYIPRTRARVAEFGFDQSKHLAKELAKKLSLPFCPLLGRTRASKLQKAMRSAKERRQNAARGLCLKAPPPDGARILLLDDLVTSGATVSAAARLLRRAGAKEIVVLSLGVVIHAISLHTLAERNSRLPYYMR